MPSRVFRYGLTNGSGVGVGVGVGTGAGAGVGAGRSVGACPLALGVGSGGLDWTWGTLVESWRGGFGLLKNKFQNANPMTRRMAIKQRTNAFSDCLVPHFWHLHPPNFRQLRIQIGIQKPQRKIVISKWTR
jgi:hypothetical protein